MSHDAYEKKVRQQFNEVQSIQNYESRLDTEVKSDQAANAGAIDKSPQETRRRLVNTIGSRFIRYVGVYKILDEVCDQIVQPQKLQILRQLLNAVIGRILELKHSLVGADGCDYHFFDQLLIDNKLTPHDIALTAPRIIKDPYNDPDSIHRQIRDTITKIPELNYNYSRRYIDSSHVPIDDDSMSFMDAITIIQGAERCRQGRMRFNLMKEMVHSEAFRMRNEKMAANLKTLQRWTAATVFQKIWKMRMAVKQCRLERSLELEFVNLLLSKAENEHCMKMENAMKKIRTNRTDTRRSHERDLENAFVELKEQIEENEEANMKSFISDTIRAWYLNEYEIHGKLPEIPEDGTKFLFEKKKPEDEENAQIVEEKAGKDAKDKKGGKDKGKDKGKPAAAEAEDDDGLFKVPASKFEEKIRAHFENYMNWDSFIDSEQEKEELVKQSGVRTSAKPNEPTETSRPSSSAESISGHNGFAETDPMDLDNRAATPDGELPRQDIHQNYQKCVVRNQLRDQMEDRVRVAIEEVMVKELDALRLVLDKKGKKGKGGKKGKKGKGKKGKKEKKEKDPTGGMPIETMEQELLQHGIMTVPPEVKFDDLVGNYQLLGSMASNEVLQPACLNDLKNLMNTHATIPMRSTDITQEMPNRVRSILLVGPPGSGKRSLAYATAHEMRATLFDLSCDNLVGKYAGPESTGRYWVNPLPAAKKHQEQLLYIVFKVAKQHQPAVIFINDADTMFFKKIPKELAETEPKRLKKDWPKIIKKFPTNEQIIVLGTATEPFGADVKGLGKAWDKILMLPRPDYGARILLLQSAIEKYQLENCKTGLSSDHTREHEGLVSRSEKIDLAALARVSAGYTSGQIMAVVAATLKSLKSVHAARTLRASDFLTTMSKIEPVSEEIDEEYTAWYYKTPLGKAFQNMQKVEEPDAKDAKKGKK